jgi:hypothetical protein
MELITIFKEMEDKNNENRSVPLFEFALTAIMMENTQNKGYVMELGF